MRAVTLPNLPKKYQLQNYDETVQNFNWEDAEKEFSWFQTNKMNIAYEAVDRHANSHRKDKIAFYYKNAEKQSSITYAELKELTNKAANVLRTHSELEKGDRLFIFMPRSPELYFTLLGALKLGVIVGPLFESFMEGAVFSRLYDSEAKVLVTTKALLKRVPIDKLPKLETIFLVGEDIIEEDCLVDFNKQIEDASFNFQIEWMEKEDHTLLHYISKATGKPDGILLDQEAMIQQLQTTRWVLDLTDEDVFWCTADPGWVTGTVYGILGPLLVGATTFVLGEDFAAKTWYEAIEDYGVTVWYSSPPAFRMLMGAGEDLIHHYDLSSLRHILSVGEPLQPEIIQWGMTNFKLRIHDTWWMTETGAHMICNFPCLPIKPGSMGKPVPGIEAAIVDHQGNRLPPNEVGNLVIKKGWPAMMSAIWQDSGRYHSYFMNNDWYVTGDSAYVDEDGYFWFQGRIDDVIITSGERIGSYEVESKLFEHVAISEAAIVDKPDPVHGNIIKAFVVLADGREPTEELKKDIRRFIEQELTVQSAPKEIEFTDELPKTQSGKIIRRVLKSLEKRHELLKTYK